MVSHTVAKAHIRKHQPTAAVSQQLPNRTNRKGSEKSFSKRMEPLRFTQSLKPARTCTRVEFSVLFSILLHYSKRVSLITRSHGTNLKTGTVFCVARMLAATRVFLVAAITAAFKKEDIRPFGNYQPRNQAPLCGAACETNSREVPRVPERRGKIMR